MSESARDENGALDDEFGLRAVRELLRLISETDVTEIKIERGNSKLHVRRGVPGNNQQPIYVTPSLAPNVTHLSSGPLPPVAPFHQGATPGAAAGAPEADSKSPTGDQQVITAPMVGTYYSAPSPRDPQFVNEGDLIQAGDVVGIVEAMKIMNEIESDISGRVVRILVASGQPVEYGQPLMIVEPD